MNQTKFWIGSSLVAGTAIYLMTPGWQSLLDGAGLMMWRRQIILLTGAISWVLMTVCMVIALRPLWLDKLMGGLDKVYGVHKWAGITVAATLVLHWLAHDVFKWLKNLGWLALPGRPSGKAEEFTWASLAEPAGEVSFYLFIVFALLALIKFFPYKTFSKLHKVFPVIYLLGAFHSVVIMPADWWRSPAAYLVAALTAVGSYAAVVSLFQGIGKSRQVQVMVTQVHETTTGVIEVCMRLLEGQKMSYRAGQFAFVDFGCKGEGHHPFSIASANQNELRFTIKPLSDFTSKLTQFLKVGQQVRLEGPYGQINFISEKPHQVWVAGGIGIAPFIGRLEELAAMPCQDGQCPVDFWYCTRTAQENDYPGKLDALCEQAGVRLHCVVEELGQRLNPEAIRQSVPGLSQTSVWFCGPAGFAKALYEGLVPMGLDKASFHAERFEMR